MLPSSFLIILTSLVNFLKQIVASLYTTYRPKNFDELLGQDQVISILKAELLQNLTAHAYIFIGPRGTGKTTTARLLAKAINCENLKSDGSPCNECVSCKLFLEQKAIDFVEIDAASNRGIDEIRAIKEKIEFKPTQLKKKIYIIDEVHMLTKEAFNALLKTLEEPPEHVVFILATTEPHKIPVTIFSRCERIEFHLAQESELFSLLKHVAQESKITFEEKAIELLASLATGSYRDGLSLLDTLLAKAKNKDGLTYDLVFTSLGLPDYQLVNDFCDAIFKEDISGARMLYKDSKQKNVHITQFLKSVILEFKKRLLVSSDQDLSQKLVKIMSIFFEAYSQLKNSFDSDLQIEIAIFNSVNKTKLADNANTATMAKESQKNDQRQVLRESVSEQKQNSVLNEVIKKKKKRLNRVTKELKLSIIPAEQKPIKTSFIPDLSLEFILSLWSSCLKTVQLQHNHLYAMLMTAKPTILLKDDMLGVYRLELMVKYDFHKKTIESGASKTILQDVLKNVFITQIQVVCNVNREMATQSMVMRESVQVQTVKEPEVTDVFDSIMEGDIESLVSTTSS